MEIIVVLLAAYGLAFIIKEKDGPWDLITKTRQYLLNNKKVGVYFYKLLSCYFCLGVQTGILITALYKQSLAPNLLITWGLASGVVVLILSKVIARLDA
jgi:hypothetical protein